MAESELSYVQRRAEAELRLAARASGAAARAHAELADAYRARAALMRTAADA